MHFLYHCLNSLLKKLQKQHYYSKLCRIKQAVKTHAFKTLVSGGFIVIFSCLFYLSQPASADTFVSDKIITNPDRTRFSMCHGQGCKIIEQLSLSDPQWQTIEHFFQPPASTPEHERQQIALAIAEFEKINGAKTGTDRDKARLFEHMGSPGQLDCIDESTNSTVYLTILKNHGLLRWHEPMDHVTRGFFIFGWPHSSAAIREINNKDREYAVDSWFEDNGKPPYIIPLEQWRDGWEPDESVER